MCSAQELQGDPQKAKKTVGPSLKYICKQINRSVFYKGINRRGSLKCIYNLIKYVKGYYNDEGIFGMDYVY